MVNVDSLEADGTETLEAVGTTRRVDLTKWPEGALDWGSSAAGAAELA